MLWNYKSENIPGNLHSAAGYINTFHPDWDVVAMSFSGSNTVVVYREPRIDQSISSPFITK